MGLLVGGLYNGFLSNGDGAIEGSLVGFAVGPIDGFVVGLNDGGITGFLVGPSVGPLVGLDDGSTEG